MKEMSKPGLELLARGYVELAKIGRKPSIDHFERVASEMGYILNREELQQMIFVLNGVSK